MTIPRVLMAACIMVLGFMLWGIHTGLTGLTTEAKGIRTDIVNEIRGMAKPIPAPPERVATSQERVGVPLPQPRPAACVCQRGKKGAVHHRRNRTPPVSIVTPSQLNEIDRLMAHRKHVSRGPPPPQHSSQY